MTTFLNAFSKSFGSSEAPTCFAISTKRLWRSASVSLGLDADLRVMRHDSTEQYLAASAVFFRCGSSGEFVACLGADAETFLAAPSGKSVRVDIDTLGHVPLVFQSLFGFFRSLYPLIPSGRKFIGVLKDFEEGRIIFFAKPSDADNSDRITVEVGHD